MAHTKQRTTLTAPVRPHTHSCAIIIIGMPCDLKNPLVKRGVGGIGVLPKGKDPKGNRSLEERRAFYEMREWPGSASLAPVTRVQVNDMIVPLSLRIQPSSYSENKFSSP